MTRFEKQQRNAVAQLLGARERYEDLIWGLEVERAGLLSRGCPIHSPVWRGCGPLPTTKQASRFQGAVDMRTRSGPAWGRRQAKAIGNPETKRLWTPRHRGIALSKSRSANSATAVNASAAP
ncbi:hypothetical protein SAMN05444166_5386 [Singulisphaera sp. GP187]|nr:hypothetical protein SAMN05444166_5386 [Singulisphaera sp. GP187]